jgi:hypothetical protein
VQPGDLIVTRPGRYVGFVLGWDNPRNGTAANPITFRGESGAIIDTRNNRTADGINLEGAASSSSKDLRLRMEELSPGPAFVP